MFEPIFQLRNMPRRQILLCGRQVSKSTGLAASQIARAWRQPNYNILTVMPLYEQVRKFSQNYVRPFIVTSPIRSRLISELGTDSVLQRQIGPLEHNSSLFYSYSSGDPSRIRGIPADECDLDEIQDCDHSDIPIIESCMGASPYKIVRLAGTPKTFDNTANLLWEDSSQAHWHIPCVCGYENKACVSGDMLNMIGDGSKRPDGSVRTLICAKCGRDLNSRLGFNVHDYPEKQRVFAGYHVPQTILPMHYESPKDWAVILETMNGKATYVFHNEVLGESYDSDSKILTLDQLAAACKAVPCEPNNMHRGRYIATASGVDWGGRGKEKTSDTDDFISNTVIALAAMRPDGIIEIPWLYKVPYAIDMSHESQMAARISIDARCDYLAMDYGGQGNVQEGLVRANGFPVERMVPFTYAVMAPTRPIVYYSPPQDRGVRSSYTLDKPRSILLLAEMIKRGLVLLPNDPKYLTNHLRDFLNIYEESIDSPSGSPRRLVKRMSRRTDDTVHAINFAVMALLHSTQRWPSMASVFLES